MASRVNIQYTKPPADMTKRDIYKLTLWLVNESCIAYIIAPQGVQTHTLMQIVDKRVAVHNCIDQVYRFSSWLGAAKQVPAQRGHFACFAKEVAFFW